MNKVICFYLSLLVFFPISVFASSPGGRKIETVQTQPAGGWEFSIGGAYEYKRGEEDTSYNNVRLEPLSLSYGIIKDLEIGARLGYSDNREHERSGIDESGFEGVSLYGKWKYWRNVAVSAGAVIGGSDEILPYGSDDVDYWVNVPFRIPTGPGRVIGEVGYIRKGGEGFEDYFNVGAGYIFDVDQKLSFRGEIRNHAKTYETGKRMLAVGLGMIYRWNEQSTFTPRIDMGLKDGSPDYAVGLTYSLKFGERGPARQPLNETPPGWFEDIEDRSEPEEHERFIVPDPQPRMNGGAERRPDTSVSISGKKKEKISEEDQREARKLNKEALAAFKSNEIDRAVELFLKALELDPYNVETRYNLATIYFHRRNYPQALEHYKTALELSPNDIDSHLGLGATYLRMNRRVAARREFEKVLEIDPANELARHWLSISQ
jgi:hypothetical protein